MEDIEEIKKREYNRGYSDNVSQYYGAGYRKALIDIREEMFSFKMNHWYFAGQIFESQKEMDRIIELLKSRVK